MQQKLEGNMDAELEAVLEAYSYAEPGPSRATLVMWIGRYPQYARELTDFTARWQLLKWAGDGDDANDATDAAVAAWEIPDDEHERMVLRGVSAAQRVFFTKRAARQAARQNASLGEASVTPSMASPAVVPIDSLIAAGRRAGLEYVALKDRLGLSDALLQKLNRRLVDPLSVPARIIADIAAELGQQVEAVHQYLALAPIFAPGAQHRASQAPTLPTTREDFLDAVRRDAALSTERKQEILALPRPGVSGTSEG